MAGRSTRHRHHGTPSATRPPATPARSTSPAPTPAGGAAGRLHLHRRRRGRHTFSVTLKTAAPDGHRHRHGHRLDHRQRHPRPSARRPPALVQVAGTAGGHGGAARFAPPSRVKDAFGNTATGYTGTVHFTSTDGQAVLPADYTFTAGDAGIHTFTRHAEDRRQPDRSPPPTRSPASITGTPAITVNAAAAQLGAIGAPLAGRRPGSAFSVTVTARTPSATWPPATPARSTSPAPTARPILPADYTFAAADAGVHTFTRARSRPRAPRRSRPPTPQPARSPAPDGHHGLPATADHPLRCRLPRRRATAGSGRSASRSRRRTPSATQRPATRGTVHFTSSDGQASLPADYTFIAGDAGVHTFTRHAEDGGHQTVTATDTVTGSITGRRITVRRRRGGAVLSGVAPPVERDGGHARSASPSRRRTPSATRPPATPAPSTSPARDGQAVCRPTTPSPPATRACTPSQAQ